jgi:hypothetical protein
MQSRGCFSSTLAFSLNSNTCAVCELKEQCGEAVAQHRVPFLRHLSDFTDSKGQSMAIHWLTPIENKRRMGMMAVRARGQIAATVYGAAEIYHELREKVPKLARPIMDRTLSERLDLRTCDLSLTYPASPYIASVVSSLLQRDCSFADLVSLVAGQCAVAVTTASDNCKAVLSILVICKRATRVNSVWRLYDK